MLQQLSKVSISELARFCAIGTLCYVVALAVLTFLCEIVHLHYIVAFVAAFLVSSGVGYTLNGRYTFAATRLDSAGALRYVLVNASLLVVNTLALATLVEWLGMWYIAATVVLAALNVPVTFLAHRAVSYRRHQHTPSPDAR